MVVAGGHQLRQQAEREQWGEAYEDQGLIFARENGAPLALDAITKRFRELVAEAGLRPVRLHDLGHGAAWLRLAAGADIAVVSKLLRHSSVSVTSDTYSHLSPESARRRPSGPRRSCPATGVTSP